jgi:hypothetical protein
MSTENETAIAVMTADEAIEKAMEALEDSGDGAPVEIPRGTAYLGMRSPSTGKNTPELTALLNDNKVENYDFFLKDTLGIRRLGRVEYHLVKYDKVWTRKDQKGNIIHVVSHEDHIPATAAPGDYKEHYFGVALVVSGSSLVPATFNFRGGMAPAVRNAVLAFQEARNPAKWESRGEAYKLSAAAMKKIPGRFVVTAWAKSDKNQAGQEYDSGNSAVRPSNQDDLTRFHNNTNDPVIAAGIGQALGIHERKMTELKSKGLK